MNNQNQRQSTNVQDKTRDAGASFPHANPLANPILKAFRQNDAAVGRQIIQQTVSNPKNPFSKMVGGMDNAARQDKGPANNPLAKIPIPTPRPDPNSKAPPKTFGRS